jgi:hypothetical protein
MRHTLLAVMLVSTLAGCEHTGAWLVGQPQQGVVNALHPNAFTQAGDPRMAIVLDGISRGPRGATIALTVTNHHDTELRFDYCNARIRLGQGFARAPLAGESLRKMQLEFGAEAYGEAPPSALHQEGRLCLGPNESATVFLTFGAPPEERSFTLDLDKGAVHWHRHHPNSKGHQEPLEKPMRLAAELPTILPPPPAWWPDGLHFGFFIGRE